MQCSVICVSHATGSGGDEVARLVAERLGFAHIDEEIVARAAARGGLSPGDVADAERRKTLAARLLESISQDASYAAALGGAMPYGFDDEPSSSDIRVLIREAIEQTAARGDVVIAAHAAAHALDPGRTLRVFVTASPRTRAERVSKSDGVDLATAERAVKAADAGRRDYLKRFYDVADELPTHYDLVVNTDGISVEEAVALVAHAAEARPSVSAHA